MTEWQILDCGAWGSCILGVAAWIVSAFFMVGFLIQDHNLRERHFGWLYETLPSVATLRGWGRRCMLVGHLSLGAALFHWSTATRIGTAEMLALLWWSWGAWIIGAELRVGWRGRHSVILGLMSFAQLMLLATAWTLTTLYAVSPATSPAQDTIQRYKPQQIDLSLQGEYDLELDGTRCYEFQPGTLPVPVPSIIEQLIESRLREDEALHRPKADASAPSALAGS